MKEIKYVRDERAIAHRGLAQRRNSLAATRKRIDSLAVELAGENDRGKIEDLRHELDQERNREGELLSDIQEREKIIFADWAPKKPPSPDRMMEIKRAGD